mmetsp:Transcript_2596/g.3860  ORF Transcript_2596/g.3860 Transcript_2596/m.3860 type:complete len:437 (-) Transcript_2596:111-1421(-)
MGNCIVTPLNRIDIVSGLNGTKMHNGSFYCICFLYETKNSLDLELFKLEVKSISAETQKGVRVNVTSICQVKVDSYITDEYGNETKELNFKAISLASQHFLGRKKNEISKSLLATLEGHQRQIISCLTVEELFRNKEMFSQRVEEHVNDEIAAMGYRVLSYTVLKIEDLEGYMEALGATQIAEVNRKAQEGKAENAKETVKSVSTNESMAKIAEIHHSTQANINIMIEKSKEAEVERELNLRIARYKAEIDTAKAKADSALIIEEAKQEQMVIQEKTKQKVIEADMLLKYEINQALRIQKQKEGKSLAEKKAKEAIAKGIIIKAQAEAMRIREIGLAEAEVITAKGEAEAAIQRKQVEAFNAYGENAVACQLVEKMPDIAAALVAPLANTNKMTFITSDGLTASKLTGDISNIFAQIVPVVFSLTGVDIINGIKEE